MSLRSSESMSELSGEGFIFKEPASSIDFCVYEFLMQYWKILGYKIDSVSSPSFQQTLKIDGIALKEFLFLDFQFWRVTEM
jgi:hypothetical protein